MSRIAIVVPPFTGHINPSVAVGAQLLARGHEAAWIGHASRVEHLLPQGARLLPLGEDGPRDLVAQVQERGQQVRGLAGLKFLWEDVLIPLAVNSLAEVEARLTEFEPDLVVVDQQALAGMLAARRLGLPWATQVTTSAGVVEPLAELPKVLAWRDALLDAVQQQAGLEPQPQPDLSPAAVIVFSTRELVGAHAPLGAQFHFVGPALGGRAKDVPFDWAALQDRPRVLVSLGTVNAKRGARFYQTVVEALGGEDLQVILVAPADLRPTLPENFIGADYVPQLELLPKVQAVVSHAGHNTVCEALNESVPLVLTPIKDDQPVVAQQVVDAGAGLRLSFGRLRPAALRQAVRSVLQDPGYRQAAAAIALSFGRAGGAVRAADLLEGML